MEKYEEVKRDRKAIFINNLIGGIAWGLGATVGVSIVLAIFGIIIRQINFVPFIGNAVIEIMKFIQENGSL